MSTTLTYTIADFIPFTKIVSGDVNQRFTDIANRVNWDGTTSTTGLADGNIQSNTVSGGGLTRATKLKAGTANNVVINDSSGNLSEEAHLALSRGGTGQDLSSLTGLGGKAIVVNASETGLGLGTPTVDRLTEQLNGDVSSIVAGEAILANDAVCLDLTKDTSNNNIYRIFEASSSVASRRVSFLGFATAAASITQQTLTWVDSADLVTSNVITWSLNGRSYSVSFTTDNNTTLAAIATAIASDPDIASASVVSAGSHDTTINITGKGSIGINISSATVTGGASQPTITITTTQSPSGGNVQVRCFGPMTGFSALTVGAKYYLSTSAGQITSSPSDTNPVFVGQALSSTVLFVNKNLANFQFSSSDILVRSLGSSAGDAVASGTTDTEHFNYVSWSSGAAAIAARSRQQAGEQTINGFMYAVDGYTTAGGNTPTNYQYNKAAWSSVTARSTFKTGGAGAPVSNSLYYAKGSTSGVASGAVTDNDEWNGSSWASGTVYSTACNSPTAFYYSGAIHVCSGVTSGSSASTAHETWNGASLSSGTSWPASNGAGGGGSRTASSKGIGLGYTNESYQWSGSWSANLPVGYQSIGDNVIYCGPASGFSSSTQNAYINGGSSSTSVSIITTGKFNGTSWSSDTSSSLARAGGTGASF